MDANFDFKNIAEKIYLFGPNLRSVIRKFNDYPEDEVIGSISKLYVYISNMDYNRVIRDLRRFRENYRKIPGIAKSIAGIGGIDDKVEELFKNTELIIAALASRFYINEKRKEKEFETKEEYLVWVNEFYGYLERELELIINIYPSIKGSGIILKKLNNIFENYGIRGFFDKLPTREELEISKNKILRLYKNYQSRGLLKYN